MVELEKSETELTQQKAEVSSNIGLQKGAKYCAILSTSIYLLLSPIFLYFGLASVMLFDNPNVTIPIGLSLVFLFCLIPLSIPVSICLIWSKYRRGQYKKSLFFCTLPILTIVGVSLLQPVFSLLLDYFKVSS